MGQRYFQTLKALFLIALAGALTWLLSWGMQYAATLFIPHERFHITREANRLALVTVLAAVVAMVAVMLIVIINEDAIDKVIFWGSGTIVSALGWVAVRIFPGTTVTTHPFQIGYVVVVFLWGFGMWYVFLVDVTDKLDTLINGDEDEDED